MPTRIPKGDNVPPVTTGTSVPAYSVTPVKEVDMKTNPDSKTESPFFSITAMPAYQGTSFEVGQQRLM